MTKPVVVYLVTEAWYFLAHHLETANEAARRGFRVVVATNIGDREAALRATGFEVVQIHFRRAGLMPIHEWLTIRAIKALYRRVQPAVVHHIALKPVVLGSIAARWAGVPHVINMITGLGFVFASSRPKARALRLMLVPVLRAVFATPRIVVITQNSDDAKTLLNLRVIVPEQLVVVRGLGVDLSRFRYSLSPEGQPVVVLPARLLWDKGVGEFVGAARRLRSLHAQARFVLVGAEDRENPSAVSNSTLQGWQQEGVVEWWGYRADIDAVYRDATIVCLPSYREGLPQSLLEASAVGRPLVATDVPGCREVVRHGINGYLVPARNDEALAEALAALIADPQNARRLGAEGRRIVEQEFTVEHAMAQIFEQYRVGP